MVSWHETVKGKVTRGWQNSEKCNSHWPVIHFLSKELMWEVPKEACGYTMIGLTHVHRVHI